MNSSAISLISQQGVDNISMLMDQCDFMDLFEEEQHYLAAPPKYDHFFLQNYTPPPMQMIMPHNYYSNFSNNNNMAIINFHEHAQHEIDSVDQDPHVAPRKLKYKATKKRRIRPPSQTYDHIMAERRRREQLSQLFVALSALIPGLKKMDKGSILEDAIKYSKELQERVEMLEKMSESKAVVTIKKTKFVDGDDDEYSSPTLPEIEAKVNDNQILVKVLCEKQKDALAKLICKVESLNMMVISTNANSFGEVTLDITIVAEMEKEFNLSVEEVVRALRECILQPAA